MKRQLFTGICWPRAAAWMLAIMVLSGCANRFGPDGPPVTPHQVSPSAWIVQGLAAQGSSHNQNFISNAGFIVTPAGVVVIDALGSPVLATKLLAEIKKSRLCRSRMSS